MARVQEVHPTREAIDTAILSLCRDSSGHKTPQLTASIVEPTENAAASTASAPLLTESGSDAGADT